MSLQELFEPMKPILGEGVLFGPDDKDIPTRLPRITWDALGGRALPPTRTDGGPGDPGPLATAEWRLQAQLWAENFAACQDLFRQFVGLAHRFLSSHSFGLGDWTWASAVTGRTGSVCTLEFFVRAPLPRLPLPVATLEQLTVAHKIGTVNTFTVNHTSEEGA